VPLFWHPQHRRWYNEGASVRAMMGPEGPYPCPYEGDVKTTVAYKWWVLGWSSVHEKIKRNPKLEDV